MNCRLPGTLDGAGRRRRDLVPLRAGVSALAGQRARLVELRRRGLWAPDVPAVVLAECLTGDPRRDFHSDRLLRTCLVREVDELTARAAAGLRTVTGRAGSISAGRRRRGSTPPPGPGPSS